MTVFKGGSTNRINYLLSRETQERVQTMNRLQSVAQTHQPVGVGNHLVTKRITRGTQRSTRQGFAPFILFDGSTDLGAIANCDQGVGSCTCKNGQPWTGISPCTDASGRNIGVSVCGSPCVGRF